MTDPDTSERGETPDKCERCRVWNRVDPGDLYKWEEMLMLKDDVEEKQSFVGECRRFPPTLNGATYQAMNEARIKETGYGNSDALTFAQWRSSQWPMTMDDDCCGEFKPAP